MLNPKFKCAFQEFAGLKHQISFRSTYPSIAEHFENDEMKWIVPGLGEAFGYCMILKESDERFRVYTFTQMTDLPDDFEMDWTIDAKTPETALQVCMALAIPSEKVTWRNSST